MANHGAFLRDIIEHPDDDTPRLVYADWLEENGQAERGEFIRVQVELARIGHLHPPADDEDRAIIRRARALRRREGELLEAYGGGWVAALCDAAGIRRGPDWWVRHDGVYHPAGPGGRRSSEFKWHCGFVAEVGCPIGQWCGEPCPDCSNDAWRNGSDGMCMTCQDAGRAPGVGPRIVRAAPVDRVRVTDREPAIMHDGGGCWWYNGDSLDNEAGNQQHHIPGYLFRLLSGGDIDPAHPNVCNCPTREAALDALSAALIFCAKQEAAKEDAVRSE